ncbi:MAG TPA: RDD family protein [Candidatus Sulfotelmatobacter sp.]|nr:RDD family protein [Candidatus Sulfotelmatobacter sp.]
MSVEAEASTFEPDGAWRDELSARLSRYRARRKAPPPRYPSLKLPFDALEGAGRPSAEFSNFQGFESTSNHALALDTSVREERAETQEKPAHPQIAHSQPQPTAPERAARPSAKIIEFPGFAWGPPVPPPDQLAEPVFDRPRILEVPEVAPPPPALGGITIEPAPAQEIEKRPGIDIPLQSAPLALRFAASFIDALLVAAASALFAYIFWKIAAFRPPQLQFLSLAAGVPCVFWAAYQYLLIVYSGATPGLRLARLELTRFDGTSTSRSLRRWRVVASYLSAASLGMGYAWLFLDEDALCWHDRITHTYLAPRKR